MSAGRRALLSAALLGSAALLAGGRARGQDRSHDLWQSDLSADRIRAALARLKTDGAGLDPFQRAVKDHLFRNNPDALKNFPPGMIDQAIKKIAENPDMMRKLEQVAREKAGDPGRPGNPDPEQLGKLLESMGKNGGLPKEFDNFKGFGQPRDDPRPADPKVGPRPPPDVNPADPKVAPRPERNPDRPPARPADPPAPPEKKDPIRLNENPFGKPEGPDDPRAKSLDALTAFWERNVGPLDQTPELKRALFDLAGENGFDFDLTDANGNSFWDALKNGTADGGSLGDLFSGAGGKWSFGDWEFPKLGDWGRSGGGGGGSSSSWWNRGGSSGRSGGGSSRSGGGSGWGGSGGGLGGLGGNPLPFLVLLLVVVGLVVFLKLRSMEWQRATPAFAGAGVGGWPVDPRAINTREDVVKAFEYLSVLVCGPAARNWTHGAIAEALADLARSGGGAAVLLARLYELARYAPLDEPLTRAELVEARSLVCTLAGVES
ncbi:MAG: hypothetical protein C0501_10900 [Isosphaera sp.]|nr:hypothetical protein [Isosphaera sp.]